MTVSKISSACWAMVAIMTLAIWPAASAVMNVHAVPVAIRATLTVVIAAAGWLSPFCYALYLRYVVLRHGDRALLERGVLGTARVLSARRTAEVIKSGESGWRGRGVIWRRRGPLAQRRRRRGPLAQRRDRRSLAPPHVPQAPVIAVVVT